MYGKLFASMYDGTLYGQWQGIVTLQQLVILADEDGAVDMTPPAIAAKTSIPIDIIEAGLAQLSEADKYSRSAAQEGRRIVLLDESRPWGWQIVNYRYYRDLANREDKKRKDRERIAEKRNKNNDVAECRNVSQPVADVAHTDTYTNTEKKKKESAAKGGRLPPDWFPSLELEAWTNSEAPGLHVPREVEKFRDYWLAQPGQKGVKACWDRTWRNWIRRNADSKPVAATPKLRLLTDA